MKKGNVLSLVLLLLLGAPAAFAWPACSGNWIGVPAGTTNANGAVVTEGGQTFQCQPAVPKTEPTNNTNTNTNNNSNSSTSKSTSSSNSNANSVGVGVGIGGNSRSSVKDSGNSSNVNTLTGGNQSQTQTANANNNSSGNSTNITESSTYTEARIPVNTAYAASVYPTVSCFKGGGLGGQAGMFGFTANGGRIDENCAILETARSFDAVNERLAACKVKINNKYAKKAGVTLADCMNVPVVVLAPIVPPQAAPVTPNITVNLPAPVVNVTPTPVVVDHTPAYVPQPVYKAPVVKKKRPIGTMRPCPPSPGTNAKANCYEDD